MNMEFFKTKRTYRRFKQETVSEDIIQGILEAGRLSSSGGNRQNLKYEVIRKPENVKNINSLVKWAAYLPAEIGTPKESEIPVLFIAVMQDKEEGAASDIDTGLAVGNMTTYAWTQGVGSCIMGAIDREGISKYLKLPESYEIKLMLAFGYPSTKSEVVDFKGDIKYYLDDEGNTCVPKKSLEETVTYFD